MPPPINHPLPARPTTHVPARPQGLPSPGLSLPRPPFFTTPQPASPRPSSSNYLPYQGGSPKLNQREAPAVEEPVAAVRKAIQAEQLRSNCDLLELGQGWKVHWRAWRGPPLLASTSNPAPSAAKVDSASSKYDPLGTHPLNSPSLSSKQSDALPAKRPKPTAFEDMLADMDEGPVASTSTLPPLKDKLQSLQQLSFASDPVELARKAILRLGQDPATGGRLLGMFSHVRVVAGKGEHGKGKGKEKETQEDEPAARMLWVFSLKRGTQMGEGNEAPSRAQLSALEFSDLTCVGKGHFSHHDLFPTLYPDPSSTSASTSSSHHAPYIGPSTRSAAHFPSALALSAELHSDLAPPASATSGAAAAGGQAPSPPQSRIKAPFEAFLAAASEALLVRLLADAAPSRPSVTTRLDSSVVYLPLVSEPFGASSRRVTSDAVKATFHLSLQRHGILIQSTVEDVPFRPFPIAVPPPPNSPLLLAPFSTPAQFVKLFPAESKRGATALAMEAEWKGLLEGTGLSLGAEEAWVLCRIALPSSTPSTTSEDTSSSTSPPTEPLEVIWPASLCILDGTKPQPSRSPPRAQAPSLAAGAPTSPLISTSDALVDPTTAAIFHPLDFDTRRRFASTLRRGLASAEDSATYRDPISYRAERVGSMLEEQAGERERKERLEKEAEAALKAAPAAPPPPTPSSMDVARVPLPNVSSASMASGGAAAPINMRTPISLGGSSTEAPSPADGFGSAERGLMQALGAFGAGTSAQAGAQELVGGTKNAEMDHLYPSPSEAMSGGAGASGGGAAGLDHPMPSGESLADHHSFPDFDWGDDFTQGAMGGRSNMPGHGQDFDEGMMMGLTDDDFSFFDDPPAPAVSLPMASFNGLQSSGPSPKFVDHFSHLTGTTPFPSAASPTSPFGHPSPHLQQHASPNLLNFGFDSSHNALGLGSTPGPLQADGASPFKTPRTPYSPFIEVAEEHDTPPTLPVSSVSLAGTPAHGLPLSSYLRRPGQFDAIPFGSSHALSDDKYDPRRGKFGLPSPDWERDHAAVPGATSARTGVDRRPLPLASLPWFNTVCNPRVAAANKLKRKRTRSLILVARDGKRATGGKGEYCARVRAREWVAQDAESDQGEEESDDEAMDLDDVSVLGGAGDEDSLADHYATGAPPAIHYTFGAALLLLRNHLGYLLAGKKRPADAPPAITKALHAADSQLEQALTLIHDQTMYNPDFRSPWTSVSLLKPSSTSILSSQAIRLVSTSLASLTTKSTCAVVPSLKEAALPPLISQRSPTILLRAQQSIMQLSSAAMSFWRPMGFEPLAGGKDAVAFAVFEEGGAELSAAVGAWLKNVTEAYEGSRLGKHSLGSIPSTGTFAGVKDGLAVVPAGTLSVPRSRDELKSLASHIAEATRSRRHVVIYILAPPEAYTASPASPIISALQSMIKSRIGPGSSWVVNPVPLSAVSRWRTIVPGESSLGRLDRLAFAVYDQLLIAVSSLAFPVPETFPSANLARPQLVGPTVRTFQSPAITMSPARRTDIEFDLTWPAASLEVLHRHRLLHVAYACSPAHGDGGLEWIAVSCVDEKGEIWKTMPRLLRIPPGASVETLRVKMVWSISKMLIDTADVEWRVIISKLGVPSKADLKAWDTQLKDALAISKRPLHVSVIGVDTRPPVAVFQPPAPQPATGPSSPALSHAHSEEGEVPASSASTTSSGRSKPAHLDTQPSVFALAPAEPIAIGPDSNVIAPASAYLVHVPRIASLSHTSTDPFMLASPAVSVLGIHFLLAHHSKTSSLDITLAQHLQDIRQSFVELASLGQTRWGTSGRVPFHLDSVNVVLDLVEEAVHA